MQQFPVTHPREPRGRRSFRPWVLAVALMAFALIIGVGAWYIVRKLAPPQQTHPTVTKRATHVSAIIPAYWGKLQNKWQQLEQTHPAGTIAIANFNAGPPPAGDSAITQIFTEAHAAGLRVVGYVATNYGGRSIADVQQKVNAWYAYPIDGIFLDEGQADDANLSYYQSLAGMIRAQAGSSHIIVLNSGSVPTSSSYLQTADIIMAYESTVSHLSRYAAPDWLTDSTRFAAIVEDVPSEQLQDIVQQCAQNYFGYVYITPDNQSYGHLPTYWEQEATALAAAKTP